MSYAIALLIFTTVTSILFDCVYIFLFIVEKKKSLYNHKCNYLMIHMKMIFVINLLGVVVSLVFSFLFIALKNCELSIFTYVFSSDSKTS